VPRSRSSSSTGPSGQGTGAKRIRLLRFIRDLTASEYAGWWDVEIIHGSGSPAAEWLQMCREYDLAGSAGHSWSGFGNDRENMAIGVEA
jgi:hypothetical protein